MITWGWGETEVVSVTTLTCKYYWPWGPSSTRESCLSSQKGSIWKRQRECPESQGMPLHPWVREYVNLGTHPSALAVPVTASWCGWRGRKTEKSLGFRSWGRITHTGRPSWVAQMRSRGGSRSAAEGGVSCRCSASSQRASSLPLLLPSLWSAPRVPPYRLTN